MQSEHQQRNYQILASYRNRALFQESQAGLSPENIYGGLTVCQALG